PGKSSRGAGVGVRPPAATPRKGGVVRREVGKVSRSKVGRTSRGPAGKPGGTRDNPPHPEARPWPERGASAADRRAEVRRGPRRSAGGGVKAHPVGRRGGGRWERGQAPGQPRERPVAERRREGVWARGNRLTARRPPGHDREARGGVAGVAAGARAEETRGRARRDVP